MARTVRDAKLDRREQRLKLEAGKRHWRAIHSGLALGYRRGKQGSGKWIVRLLEAGDKYALATLGSADDYAEANGHDVLDFRQAQERALTKAAEAQRNAGILPRDSVTVEQAAATYMEWFRQHRKSVRETELSIGTHILPAFGDAPLNKLTTKELRAWHERLATQPARRRTGRFAKTQNTAPAPLTAEDKRRRQATANRVLSVFKAILNRAFQDGLVADDSPWRRVKPFAKAESARVRFLSDDEAARLVKAASDELRPLVRGALLTGMRYGEMRALRVRDVDLRAGRVFVAESKSGHPRHIPLNPEGRELFEALCTDRNGEAFVFTKSDGVPWGESHQQRPLRQACEAAGIEPMAFHELRHTYASALAQAGVDLLTISKLLGHADTRITARHYAHLADATLRAAVEQLPSFGAGDNVVAFKPRGAS